MEITHGDTIWSQLKAKCSDKMYEAIITLRDKLDAEYGEGNIQYIFQYGGIDEEGTESMGVMIAGAVVSYSTVKVTKNGEVIM